MSIQLAAKHLAAHGRGPDTTLVHMTPGEVASLQALAQQHGGSLSINPQTGLPEAGFLSALLPMAAGAGLAAMGMPAGYAALAVGATSAATNGGNMKKSLLDGISAYSGAGMAGSFMGAGLGTMGGAMGTSAAAPATALEIPAGATSPYALTGSTAAAAPSTAGYSLGEPSSYLNQPLPSLVSAAPAEVAQAAAAATPAAQAAQQAASLDSMSMGQRFDALKAGATGTNAMNYIKANPFTSLGVATAAMTPDENKTPQKATDTDRGPRAGLSYHPGWTNPMPKPNMQGVEQTYNRPYYAAEGGLMSLAEGGKSYDDVEMSPAMRQLLAQQDRSLREIQRLKAQQTGTPPAQLDQKQLFADYLKRVSGATGAGAGIEVAPEPEPEAEVVPETPKVDLPFLETPVSSNTRSGGGGQSEEQRAEREAAYNAPQDYLSINRYDPEATARVTKTENAEPGDRYAPARETVKDSMSAAQLAALSPAERAMHMADVRAISPIRTAVYDAITEVGVLPILGNMYTDFKYGNIGKPLAPGVPKAPVRDVQPGEFTLSPAAMQAAVAESNAAADRTYGNSANSGPANDGRADPGGEGKTSYGSVAAGYTGGSEAADGGLSTPYGFQHMAHGGSSDPYDLGSFSDGGRLLKGPGDGVSDSIPATIGKGRPARLADGEFVIPARIVSEIGNGSTEAGARKLYAMMDRIQAGRKKSVGKGKVAVNSRADKYLPA